MACFKHLLGDICHPVLESKRLLGKHRCMQEEAIRDGMSRQRALLSPEVVHDASALVMRRVKQLEEFCEAELVAAYVGIRGEIDPWPILEAVEIRIALPVVRPGGVLEFVLPSGPLQPGPFGIRQPVSGERVSLRDLDVVLVPVVVADKRCNRMGHGAGYYDRTFAFRLEAPAPPLLIGIAHSFQVVPSLNAQSWDVPLDILATEQGILLRKPQIGED
mgnify:CR=1 FL=1